MKITYARRLFILFFCALNLLLLFHKISNAAPSEMHKAAQEGIATLLRNTPPEMLSRIGFPNPQDIERVSVGQGYQVFTIHPQNILNSQTWKDLHSSINHTDVWQFLLMVGDAPRSMITVEYIDHHWKAVSIGSSGLAREFYDFLSVWPSNRGYEYRLVRIYQATSDFMEVFEGNRVVGFVPLASARSALGLSTREMVPLDSSQHAGSLRTLKESVRKNVERNGYR